MYVAITDQEQDALRGTDYALTVLYLHIKQFMDYKTGIVGYARRISYQSMSEALYIEPRQGVKGGSPHISSIRRMIDQLIKCGILKKSRKDTLVFKLPFADTDSYAQNKADRKSTVIADDSEFSNSVDSAPKADTPKKAKADIPHLSLNPINKAAAANIDNVMQETSQQNAAAAENLHFHKTLHEETTQEMRQMLKGFKPERQQELLDELSYCINKKKVAATPIGLFIAMVNQAKSGAWIATGAHTIKKAREMPTVVEQPRVEPTAEEREINKEKGREAMGKVKNIFGNKKTA